MQTDEARGTSRVVFTINEGDEGRGQRIQFEGNTQFTDKSAQADEDEEQDALLIHR